MRVGGFRIQDDSFACRQNSLWPVILLKTARQKKVIFRLPGIQLNRPPDRFLSVAGTISVKIDLCNSVEGEIHLGRGLQRSLEQAVGAIPVIGGNELQAFFIVGLTLGNPGFFFQRLLTQDFKAL